VKIFDIFFFAFLDELDHLEAKKRIQKFRENEQEMTMIPIKIHINRGNTSNFKMSLQWVV